MEISMALTDVQLYDGCAIEEVGGRLTLTTPVAEAVNVVGRNAQAIVDDAEDRDIVVLTGSMAVWSYLVVFHVVVHQFSEVWYDDGHGNRVLIAKH